MSDSKNLLERAIRGLGRRVRAAVRGAPPPSGPPFVHFEGGVSGPVSAGATLLEAAKQLGVELNHYCGGTCSCGTCRLEIVEGGHSLSAAEGRERMVLGPVYADGGDRLGCQAKVLGTVHVRVPARF